MEPNLDTIFVLATNIKTQTDMLKISTVLNTNPAINKWSIDQEDIDCVLRIESNSLTTQDIIALITQQNFNCNDLE